MITEVQKFESTNTTALLTVIKKDNLFTINCTLNLITVKTTNMLQGNNKLLTVYNKFSKTSPSTSVHFITLV